MQQALLLWHLLLGLAKVSYIWCCFLSLACVMKGEAFGCNNLLCVTQMHMPVCIHTHRAFFYVVSIPEDIWLPSVKHRSQEHSLKSKNPTANFISYSWGMLRILLFCRQVKHTANSPFPFSAATEESIAAPRCSCSTGLLCHPSKETAIETPDHEAFEFSSVFLVALGFHDGITLEGHNAGWAMHPTVTAGTIVPAQGPCVQL